MKRLNKIFIFGISVVGISAAAANLPSDWQKDQPFAISETGLVKIALPVETLNAARPALEDLRLYDDGGNEIPYLIERPGPPPKIFRAARSFQVSLHPSNSIVTLETGSSQPLDAVELETPAMDFIKSVAVEKSDDSDHWQVLAQGRAIFRQLSGAANLKISFPATAAKFLRLTIDDARSSPIPFTGARFETFANGAMPNEILPVVIFERNENPGETRLAVNLPAANLDMTSVQIETDEPLFMRQVVLAVPQISEDSIREQTIGQGTIYRIAVENQTPAENLSVPLGKVVESHELILLIKNGDSPPLPVKSASIERRPVCLAFLARQAGKFHLLTGNPQCAAPQYDLAALNMDLKSIAVASAKIPSPEKNPNYQAPEVLPGIEVGGAPLDTAAWKFRQPIKIATDGAQQVELNLDALAHANPDFADLRVMNGSNQVPYIIERTSISRAISPTVTLTNDAKNPALSRWLIQLPQANLPLTRLTCSSPTPLFNRSLTLYENVTDERGAIFQRDLGQADWTRTPNSKKQEFTLGLNEIPQTDKLFLKTENGDNPPIALEKFHLFYPATRILFKARAGDELFLYYGNPNARPPSYDLSLVANQLLAANKKSPSAGEEQQLRKSSWRENEIPGKGGVLFWGVLALVAIVLLAIISKLLPKIQN